MPQSIKFASLLLPHSVFAKMLVSPGNWCYPLKAFDKFLRRIRWLIGIETPFGIKFLGRGLSSDMFNDFVVETRNFADLSCSLDDFVINPDLLVDSFSLTGSSILKSPHLDLMETIDKGKDVFNTDYAFRFSRGLLDLRRGGPLDSKALKEIFYERHREMVSRVPSPVKVIPAALSGKMLFAVVDGKHRLAMAVYLNITDNLTIHLLDPRSYKMFPFYRLYELAARRPELYRKNLSMLECFYGIP